MPGQHAFLSASAAHRWINCPPSAKICAEIIEKEGEGTSVYAQEGTDAHELCEYKLKSLLGMETSDPTENLTYYNQEMEEHADDYASFVMEKLQATKETCSDPLVLVEQRVDFSRWVPDGFGTADCLIIADDTMNVIDFKYGLGVLVSAEENPQMFCYALGALELFDVIYDIQKIHLTIFQPRKCNVSEYEISKADLLKWADKVLSPAAKLAFNGDGEFKAGEHCQFCKIKHECRKRAEHNLELAKYDFKMPDFLTNQEISIILERIDSLIAWANDVKEYALSKALDGEKYEGFKLVEGRSVRKFTDPDKVAEIVKATGKNPYEEKLLGLTDMQKLLGKRKFEELLGEYIYKPQGKPTLAPAEDKRPEFSSAETDFNDK